MKLYKTIAELKKKNESIDRHWFSKETMSFFDSRIEGGIYDGDFFISSEKYNDQAPRLYKVRQGTKEGHIATLSEWLPTLEAAQEKVKQLQADIIAAQPDANVEA